MSEPALTARGDLLRLRKERVHSTMLVEVLALLIFMAMTFAFVLRDDAARTNPWKQKHDQVAAELKTAKVEVASLKRQVSELERANRQLLRTYTGTIAANDAMVIDKAQWRELINKLANAEAIVESQQRANAAMQERLNGRGGSDLPNCTVSPETFIVRIDLVGGGYRVSPLWNSAADGAVSEVTGLKALASSRTLSTGEFRRLAAQVRAWGRGQAIPCNFRAQVFTQGGVITVAQQNIIGDAFYARVR